jgi:hypothetical protein
MTPKIIIRYEHSGTPYFSEAEFEMNEAHRMYLIFTQILSVMKEVERIKVQCQPTS